MNYAPILKATKRTYKLYVRSLLVEVGVGVVLRVHQQILFVHGRVPKSTKKKKIM